MGKNCGEKVWTGPRTNRNSHKCHIQIRWTKKKTASVGERAAIRFFTNDVFSLQSSVFGLQYSVFSLQSIFGWSSAPVKCKNNERSAYKRSGIIWSKVHAGEHKSRSFWWRKESTMQMQTYGLEVPIIEIQSQGNCNEQQPRRSASKKKKKISRR